MIAIIILLICFIVAVAAILVGASTSKTRDGSGHQGEPGAAFAVAGGAVLFFLAFLALFSHTFIGNQHVGYAKVFGVVQPDTHIEPGFHLKSPVTEISQVDTAVSTMVFSATKEADGDQADEKAILEGLTADQVLIHVDLAVSWKPVAANVPAFKRTFGTDGKYDKQVYSIIRSSVRDTIATTNWKEGAIQNRAVFAQHIKAAIETKTTDFFKQAGLGARASNMVEYGAVNLRKIIPPEQIQQANNDLAAADIQNQLQDKLFKVEESKKQVQEAKALNNNNLVKVPAGMTARDYAEVLHAMTEQMNAETVRDSIKNGKPVTVVVGMGVVPTATTPIK